MADKQHIPVADSAIAKARTSTQMPVILGAAVAGVNGTTVPTEIQVPYNGNQFQVLQCSANFVIQPQRGGSVGVANLFQSAQGQYVSQGFDTLICRNYNLFPVVALVWVGWDDFINNQLIINQTTNQPVTYPTQSNSVSPPNNIPIPDLSGQPFTDINGKKWLALFRIAIVISNISTGVTLLLQKTGANTSNGAAVLAIPPGLPLAHNSGGDFALNVGGSSVPALVSEIYSAIPG